MYRTLCFLYLLFAILNLANGTPVVGDSTIIKRPRIGLVLGGGGAKGAAEVGVLKVLEEEGVPVDYIAGTSIGAIVGGLYSVGYRADSLRVLLRNADWQQLLADKRLRIAETFNSRQSNETFLISVPVPFLKSHSVAASTRGFVEGNNLYNFFSKLTIGYHRMHSFKSLPIPFTAIATDLKTGQEIEMDSGSLPLAMRSSMSIPGFFEPVQYGSHLLVDGGTINNFPVDVVKKMGADIIIGIDLSQQTRLQGEELKGLAAVIHQLVNIMGQQKYKANTKVLKESNTDIYINPNLKEFGTMSFSQTAIDTMYKRGYEAADSLRYKFRKLRESLGIAKSNNVFSTDVQHHSSPDFYSIENINFYLLNADSTSSYNLLQDEKNHRLLLQRSQLVEHSIIDQVQLEKAVEMLRGMGIFSSVQYTLSSVAPYNLDFYLDASSDARISVGARFDNEFVASVLVNMSNLNVFSGQHHYSFTARLSKLPYFKAEYFYGHLFGARLGISYKYQYNNFDAYVEREKIAGLDFNQHSCSLFYLQSLRNFQLSAGALFEYFHFRHSLFQEKYSKNKQNNAHFLNYFVQLSMDNFNRRYFPTRGWTADALGMLHTDDGFGYKQKAPFLSVSVTTSAACPLTSRFTWIPSVRLRFLLGDNMNFVYSNVIGGNFNGMYMPQQQVWATATHLNLINNKFAAVSSTFRYRLQNNIYMSAIGEYGKTSKDFNGLIRGHNLWGIALQAAYDFILGPLSLQVNYSNISKSFSWYVNAGFYF
ncbi:patatin-like phospholipase family protein [Alloprevotella rava]|uniref:patatin-like phospholipase family protein n=1 Tax=Alloprevotella rava TaxID=671218 RepID=UPI001C84A89E|nr:patatin-like phospholipase family protein [Alloprevotella rava]